MAKVPFKVPKWHFGNVFGRISYYKCLKNQSGINSKKQISELVGKSERTIKRCTVEMQEKGLIARENGKRNGKWKILIEA